MQFLTPADSVRRLRPGQRVFVPGASGAPTVWIDALLAEPDANRGIALTTTYIPGINRLPLDHLHDTAKVSGLFAHPGSAAYRHLPISYAGFLRNLADAPPFDIAVVQVSPPDERGMCSLGPLIEFSLVALARAARRIAVVNLATPRMLDSCALPIDCFAEVVQSDAALAVYTTERADPLASAIARHVAGFVEDGATVQIGLGKVPGAVLGALGDRRNLKFHSGMLSDGLMSLHQQGALARDHAQLACALVGTKAFYDWAAEQNFIRVRGCEVTHAPTHLAALERFVAINSALEVDLFGQCNLEFLGGRAVSGPGGAPDFAAAARRCRCGISIVALPASSHGASRIRPRLDVAATLSRADVDVVVTEHGAADLRGASVHERAERLISIAMPAVRSALADEWKDLAR